MLVNGLTLGLLLFLAALVPMLLGLLVAMPVLFGSLYASYQAIFRGVGGRHRCGRGQGGASLSQAADSLA
jgi:hypothetical protein